MSDILINNVINIKNNKLIYVYDFLNMWTFLIELVEVAEGIKGIDYPNIIFSKGEIPKKAPEKKFESEKRDIADGENPESYK